MKPLILDSALGTELENRGEYLPSFKTSIWSAYSLIHNPDVIKQIHIDNIETVSNYKKLVLHKNPDFQPINFRRKIRTTFVLKDGNSKHVVDMSMTKFSEQGLENLEDCSPRYEVEYDYNGKDNSANNHVDFLKGMVTLLYSVSPNTAGNSKKRRHGSSTTVSTKRRRLGTTS